MSLGSIFIIVIGLALFEIISGIDNAVVNADVLHTMSEKWRRWFLFYGIIVAVFVVRGLLPVLIIYFATPGISFMDAITSTMSSDPAVSRTVENQAPILLAGGGIFLLFLFLHWLFMEEKKYAFFLESHIHKNYSFWFYALASIVLLTVVWTTIRLNPLIALGSVVGSTAFFIVSGFKSNAEAKERELKGSHMAEFSKVLYLELIDSTFSIDGVLGAFAFTLSVPLIFLGNGIGAFVVRYLTVNNISTVRKYAYLKNGAMYSIGVLGVVMLMESLGYQIYSWTAPAITFLIVGVFFYLSRRELEIEKAIS